MGTAQLGTSVPSSLDGDLPALQDIFAFPGQTRDFVGEGLLPIAEREFLKCIAKAIYHNREDAWTTNCQEALTHRSGQRAGEHGWS